MSYYYLDTDGQTVRGPLTAEALRSEWVRRPLPPGTPCCREGSEAWLPLDSLVDELYQPGNATAAKKPAPVTRQSEERGGIKAGTWVPVAVLSLAALVALLVMLSDNPERKMERLRQDAYYTATEQWIRPQMKNPSAAKFSSFDESAVDVSGDTYTVRGWVEGPNSFGATVRKPFHCRLKLSTDRERWISEDCGWGSEGGA